MDQHNGPEFVAEDYNKPGIRKTHNCYDYAIGHLNPDQNKKSQPGRTKFDNDLQGEEVHNCQVVEDLLVYDHPEIMDSDLIEPCPYGYHKIGLMIDPEDDYHFIRQDPDGYWSHKPGAGEVTKYDFSGRKIVNPELSDFNNIEADLNYTEYCGYYCVMEDGHFADAVKN